MDGKEAKHGYTAIGQGESRYRQRHRFQVVGRLWNALKHGITWLFACGK